MDIVAIYLGPKTLVPPVGIPRKIQYVENETLFKQYGKVAKEQIADYAR